MRSRFRYVIRLDYRLAHTIFRLRTIAVAILVLLADFLEEIVGPDVREFLQEKYTPEGLSSALIIFSILGSFAAFAWLQKNQRVKRIAPVLLLASLAGALFVYLAQVNISPVAQVKIVVISALSLICGLLIGIYRRLPVVLKTLALVSMFLLVLGLFAFALASSPEEKAPATMIFQLSPTSPSTLSPTPTLDTPTPTPTQTPTATSSPTQLPTPAPRTPSHLNCRAPDRPIAQGSKYIVQCGDTLNRIADRAGLKLEDLLAANPEYRKNPDLIHPGDIIKIPTKMPKRLDR